MKCNSNCSMITGSSVELQTKPISNVTAGPAWKYHGHLKKFGNKYWLSWLVLVETFNLKADVISKFQI